VSQVLQGTMYFDTSYTTLFDLYVESKFLYISQEIDCQEIKSIVEGSQNNARRFSFRAVAMLSSRVTPNWLAVTTTKSVPPTTTILV
jgi:hypothetical protein